MGAGIPIPRPVTAGEILSRLGLSGLTAGALLFASSATALDKLALGTAGRVLVAGASAPAWSDSGLSYASSVLTVAGSVPAAPSAGQVAIGGGVVKAGTAVYGADGSAAAPGIRTTTYAHGMYSAAATIAGFAVGGVASLAISQPGGGIGSGFRLLTTADADYCYFLTDRPNAELRITAGNTTTNGANLQLFGSGHATASTGRLRVSGTSVLEWNATGITAAQAITAPNGTAAAPGIRTTTYAHGLYSASAVALGLSVAGTSAAFLYKPSGTTYGGALGLATPTAAEGGLVFASSSNSFVTYGGGSSVDVGGWARAYGQAHATKPNYLEFGYTTTVAAYFNGSGVLTVNTSTASTSTTTGALVVTGGVGVGGAGYFGGNLSAAGGALILGGKATFNVYGGNTAAVGGIAASGWENLEFYTCTSGGTSTKRGAFDNTGKLTLTGTSDGILTVPGKIAAKVVVPGSFADLAAVQSYLASILT